MAAVPFRFQDHQLAVWELLVHELTNSHARNGVMPALQEQRPRLNIRQVLPIVGKEGHGRKMVGDRRVQPAEAALQFSRQLRRLRIAHQQRGERRSPGDLIAFQQIEEFLDVRQFKPAPVVSVVDKTRRGTHHDERFEEVRLAGIPVRVPSESRTDGAYRVPGTGGRADRRSLHPLPQVDVHRSRVVGCAQGAGRGTLL